MATQADIEHIRQRYAIYGPDPEHNTAVYHIKQLLDHIDGTEDNHMHRCEHNANGTWCEQWADQHHDNFENGDWRAHGH